MNFKSFYLLKESGSIFPDTDDIEQENITPTLKQYEKEILLPVLGLSLNEVGLLGSALKKTEPSGDIDLAIPIDKIQKKFGVDNLLTKIAQKLPIPNKVNKGLSQIYTKFNQYDKNNRLDKYVQIDLFIGKKEFLDFSFYGPYETESKYKGAIRNRLLMALASTIKESSDIDVHGKEFKRIRLGFDINQGLMKYTEVIKKTRFEKILKDKVTDDPNKIAKILLGKEHSAQDLKTFESIWKIINKPNYIHRDKLSSIVKEFKETLDRSKLKIPIELGGENGKRIGKF